MGAYELYSEPGPGITVLGYPDFYPFMITNFYAHRFITLQRGTLLAIIHMLELRFAL